MPQTRGELNAAYSAWVLGTKVTFSTNGGEPWQLREPLAEITNDELPEYYTWMHARNNCESTTYRAYKGQLND